MSSSERISSIRFPLLIDHRHLTVNDHHAEVFEEAFISAVVDDALVDLARLELVWGEGTLNFSAVMDGVAFGLLEHGA